MAVYAIAPSSALSSATVQESGASKIAPWVLEHTAGGKQVEFLIVLADEANLRDADELRSKEEKGRFVRDALWNKARSSQGALLKWLTDHNVEHRSFYIVNMVWVKGGLDLGSVANAQTLTVRLSNVTDQFSQVLPDALVSVTLLIGDTNGNGNVNAGDIAQTKSQIGQLVTAGNFRTDINVNGTINASDVTIIKSQIGTSIP
jgi:hypothetical protein